MNKLNNNENTGQPVKPNHRNELIGKMKNYSVDLKPPGITSSPKTQPGKEIRPSFNYLPLLMVILLSISLISSCSNEESKRRYSAEKLLFEARKMNEQLGNTHSSSDFLDKTISTYRRIVEENKDVMYEIDEMEYIVISAQMELSQLQFRYGMLADARDSFMKAYQLARNLPEASVNALYSSAIITEELGDYNRAIDTYSKLFNDYLKPSMALRTASMNTRYLITPLNLAELLKRKNKGKEASEWFDKAEELYRFVANNSEDSLLVKEVNFNLLTTYIQDRNWSRAASHLKELKKLYRDSESDKVSLAYTEGQIYKDGFEDIEKAKKLFEEVYENHPETVEALNALLTTAALEVGANNLEKAKKLYRKIVNEYSSYSPKAAEALWQLAVIAENEGNWVEASLRFNELYRNYPATIYGLEAPLRIARHFRNIGESDAERESYRKAIEHYQNLVSSDKPTAVILLAEEYIITSLSEQKEWGEAIDKLLYLPEKYPDYVKFRENFLMAASIYENELGDKGGAIKTLKECIEKYPQTEIAAIAKNQIERLEGN